MNRYIILILCVIVTSIGHVLFKSAASALKSLDSIWNLALEPVFLSALFLYGVSTLVWIWCLQEIPLNQAYLFMSLAYVFIPVMAWFYLGEMISPYYFISTSLIVGGILVAVMN